MHSNEGTVKLAILSIRDDNGKGWHWFSTEQNLFATSRMEMIAVKFPVSKLGKGWLKN